MTGVVKKNLFSSSTATVVSLLKRLVGKGQDTICSQELDTGHKFKWIN